MIIFYELEAEIFIAKMKQMLMKDIYTNEFSKIDNNVSNVFCSDDSFNDFLFYTTTDGSLWMIGNSARTGITSIIDNGYTIVPIKVMDNINMVDEEYKKNIY